MYLSEDYDSEIASVKTSRSSAKPRTPKAKEYFPSVDKDSEFSQRHHFWCMFSSDMAAIHDDDKRPSTMCQGCSFMYHVECLGDKSTRLRTGHTVIVLDERAGIRTCVLQCGQCKGGGKNGANTLRCAGCGEIGDRCGEFEYPTKVEGSDEMGVDGSVEEKPRDEEKLLDGWNDASKVLFRCIDCHRGYHFHHLPPPIPKSEPSTKHPDAVPATNEGQHTPNDVQMDVDNSEADKSIGPVAEVSPPDPIAEDQTMNPEEIAVQTNESQPTDEDQTEIESSSGLTEEEETLSPSQWRCSQCTQYMDKKIEKVLGWRPTDTPSYSATDLPDDFLREYLIKFEHDSYSHVLWVPGTWLSGIAFAMKRNFDAEERASIKAPEDVIPKAWLRADIVFDVRYEGDLSRDQMRFRSRNEELEALSKVTEALCKFQQLKYEECLSLSRRCLTVATWDVPPKEDSERFADFKAAYEEYVYGNWTHSPAYRGIKTPYADSSKSEDVIQAEFGHRLEKKTQPEWMEGGVMFDYQIEGMKYSIILECRLIYSWLYFQWYKQTSAILADEMGLGMSNFGDCTKGIGKTIQVVAMVSTIFKEQKRWPFLVIAPSSTLENWRREFKKWAPSVRVVVWPGTSEGRKLVV